MNLNSFDNHKKVLKKVKKRQNVFSWLLGKFDSCTENGVVIGGKSFNEKSEKK